MVKPGKFEVKDASALVYEAKLHEKKKNFEEASRGYRKAKKIFKKYDDRKMHYAKCLVGHYMNSIKSFLEERDLEPDASNNMVEDCINKIVLGIKDVGLDKHDEYEILIAAYQELETILRNVNNNHLEDKVYYDKTKLYSKFYRYKKSKTQKVSDKIKCMFYSVLHWGFNWFCGHGDKLLRAVVLSFAFVLIFSVIFCGFDLIQYSTPNGKSIGWLQSLYFSIVTFTTLGFGDITPTGLAGQTLVAIEVMMGYLMLGALIAIVIRKITR